MSFENEEEGIEIDYDRKTIRGKTTAGKWKEHFDKVKEVFE